MNTERNVNAMKQNNNPMENKDVLDFSLDWWIQLSLHMSWYDTELKRNYGFPMGRSIFVNWKNYSFFRFSTSRHYYRSSFLPNYIFIPSIRFILRCQIYAHFQRSRIVRTLRPLLISLFSCEKQKSLSFVISYSECKVTRLCMSILTSMHFTEVMMFPRTVYWQIIFLVYPFSLGLWPNSFLII